MENPPGTENVEYYMDAFYNINENGSLLNIKQSVY